jgi:hypothetical protein
MAEMDDVYGSKPGWKSLIPSSTDNFEATLVKTMKNLTIDDLSISSGT